MKVYNTLTKQIEEFIPNNGKEVRLYTCGPTVYHYAHIGNLRSYLFEDILEKSLTYLGYNVLRFMNITDLGHLSGDSDTGEDKMSKSALKEHKTVTEIADFYTKTFLEDLEKLNIQKPAMMDKASNLIPEYIVIIKKLIENKSAYISNGNVYFDVSTYKDYYKLSGRNEQDNIIGARENVEEDESKRNSADFGLWFTNSKFANQIQQYDSPWGKGYPGWHIECSGLAIKYLGDYLDIHCGGVDNIFPHHSNEIAQSENYLGHKWCNYWMHCEYLKDKNGKMSKSKGDSLILNTLIDKGYDPLAYRYMVLTSHYRNQLEFSYEALDSAKISYDKLKQRISKLKQLNEKLNQEKINIYQEQFKKALANDLNTSSAITVLYDLLKDDINNDTKIFLIKDFDKVLSLDLFVKEEKEINKAKEEYIKIKIAERNKAKEEKNYELSDKIREELKNEGILIKDTKEETTWEII